MFNKLNKQRTVQSDVDTRNMEFKPLKDFCGTKINVRGFFFTAGKWGDQTVVVGNDYLINMPSRATEQFKIIADDEEMVEAVLNGKLMITDIKMVDTKNGKTTAYTLADC